VKIRILVLGICMVTLQHTSIKGDSLSSCIGHLHPELSGLIHLAPPIKIIPDKKFHVPRFNAGTIEIDAVTDYSHDSFAFHLSHVLQLAALLAREPNPTLQRYLSFELVSHYFALRYFDTFSPNAQKKCKQQLLSSRCMLDYHLISDYQRLGNSAKKIAVFDLLINHVITRYRENRGVINAMDKAAAMAMPARDLAVPTHFLMTQGGDYRINLDKDTGVNKYYAAPRPDFKTILRSSSTASFQSEENFIAAEKKRIELLIAALSGDLDTTITQSLESIRTTIKKTLSLPSTTRVILTPCGTSSEMMITLLGLSKHKNWNEKYAKQESCYDPLLINILTASEEVGSKSSLAANLDHMCRHTPSGKIIEVPSHCNDVPENSLKTVLFSARNVTTGKPHTNDEIETKLYPIIADAINKNNQVVILHFVHASKTGLTTPSLSFIQQMKHEFKDTIIIVVDAAQMRCNKEDIAAFLDHNLCVMITGSKFFAGAPFSGAILLPPDEALSLHRDDLFVPSDFSYYFNESEIDPTLAPLKKQLGTGFNFGLLLRWETALVNMHNFYATDKALRDDSIKTWATNTKKIIRLTPGVSLLEDKSSDDHRHSMLGKTNSIISIQLYPINQPERNLTFDELKNIHTLMTQDVTQYLPVSLTDCEKLIAQTKILIGQPVILLDNPEHHVSILRLSLSAPSINALAKNKNNYTNNLTIELEKDTIVLQKLSLLMKYHDYITTDKVKT